MSTFLALCQDMARDVGIPGTGPSTTVTTGLSEEEISVIRYINQADQDIQSRWFDWDFLWSEASITAINGTSTLSSSNTGFPGTSTIGPLGNWKLDSIVWDKTSDSYQILEYVEWNEYRENYKYGTVDSDVPEVFTIKPDGNIDLYPTPNSATVVSAEYWRTPVVMSTVISPATTADDNVSAIPARFHKIIISRAKMYYAENEDAPEIMVGSLSEFEDLLDKLEADQLVRQKNRRFSSAQNMFNFVVRPE
tara:strand:+ start:201 stop:950 length:750 start_codon:yes stop_codon:yes gene_type:complete